MRKTAKSPGEKNAEEIKPATRKQYSGKEQIRIVLGDLRGENSIIGFCRRKGIAESLYYN